MTEQTPSTKRTLPLLVEACRPEQFALFPSESGGGVTISQIEMLQLSRCYSALYALYISRLSEQLVSLFDISELAAGVLARRALVPLVHCFLDRLVRVSKAISCEPGQLVVPRQELFPATDTIEAFEACAVSSPAFNQSMISLVGRVWQLPECDEVPESTIYKSQEGFKNNLFRLHPERISYLIRIRRIVLRLLARLSRERFPTLTMAYATDCMLEHGFYSKYLSHDVSLKWQLQMGHADKGLRAKLFSDDFIENSELNEFLTWLGMGVEERSRTRQVFKTFLQLYHPTTLLEAIPENMLRALRVLQPFKKKALISSGGRNSLATYVDAAAKQTGFFIVNHQHGGHYGYIEDVSGILEMEYPGMDQFISWGWSRLPDHHSLKDMSVIGMPSPWLSERKRYWLGLKIGGEKEFDFLLMPNMLKRFPAAPHGASTSRIDHIQEFAISLIHLVGRITEKNFSILHKPYNPTTVKLLTKTMKELERVGGSKYSCAKQLDKGLTHELLRRCHMVLWDQPGTGFLECLSSNIPTMIYWPRFFSQEEAWLRPLFGELEQLGLVHRHVDSLIEQMQRYKKSPIDWMNHPGRTSLISRFCREFAWTSDEWPAFWRRYLDEPSMKYTALNQSQLQKPHQLTQIPKHTL